MTPSMKDRDRLDTLIDKSNPEIMAFKEKFGTYILYRFDQLLDFAYQFDEAVAWREAKLTYLEKEDVAGAVSFLQQYFLGRYGDSLKMNFFPRKLLICSKINARTLGLSSSGDAKVFYHDAVTNMNSFTISGLDRKSLSEMDADRQEQYIRQIHYIYLAGYLVDVRREVFVENVFFDAGSKLYGTKIDRKEGVEFDDEYFMSKGFFHVKNDVNYYPQQLEDLMIFIKNLVFMDQPLHDAVKAKSVMRIKMQYVARGLKSMGVDISAINPLVKDFL